VWSSGECISKLVKNRSGSSSFSSEKSITRENLCISYDNIFIWLILFPTKRFSSRWRIWRCSNWTYRL
jgi:hypothetical protein